MTVYRYSSDYQYNPEPDRGRSQNGKISISNNPDKTVGRLAFAFVAVPLLIAIAMSIFGQIAFPCETAGFSQGPFGCDSKAANDYAAMVWLPMALHILMIPVSLVMGIIALVKSQGAGWGIFALLPIPGWIVFWSIAAMFTSGS